MTFFGEYYMKKLRFRYVNTVRVIRKMTKSIEGTYNYSNKEDFLRN